jgi:hypothetical protein
MLHDYLTTSDRSIAGFLIMGRRDREKPTFSTFHSNARCRRRLPMACPRVALPVNALLAVATLTTSLQCHRAPRGVLVP